MRPRKARVLAAVLATILFPFAIVFVLLSFLVERLGDLVDWLRYGWFGGYDKIYSHFCDSHKEG